MKEQLEREILQRLTQLEILQRVDNVLLSKFILQLQLVKKILHLPQLKSYWKFELLEEEYVELIKEFDRKDVDRALYYLDRLLIDNKMDCPNNIKQYIRKHIKQKIANRNYRNAKRQAKTSGEEES